MKSVRITLGILIAAFSLLGMESGVGAPITNSLPPIISTTDGKTYNDVKLLKVQPDGLVVQYVPNVGGGLGITTLKFVKLPESLQQQFGYNSTNAADYEKAQAADAITWSEKMQADEKIKADTQTQNARPIFIWHIGEPTVGYSYYDSTGAKPEVFDSDPWAVAMTQHYYTYESDFTFRGTRQGDTNGIFIFYFDTITVSLGLSNHITLPENAYDSIKAHEEGHRKLYENFYQLGQPVAQQAVESMMNKGLTMYGPDYESARRNALNYAKSIFQVEYYKRIEAISQQANVRYDEIASHDGRFFNPDETVKKLTEEYEQKVWVPDAVTDLSSPFHRIQ